MQRKSLRQLQYPRGSAAGMRLENGGQHRRNEFCGNVLSSSASSQRLSILTFFQAVDTCKLLGKGTLGPSGTGARLRLRRNSKVFPKRCLELIAQLRR